ncbi:MAG: oligosaccharide flippase family protein [Thermoleophilia bacterium]
MQRIFRLSGELAWVLVGQGSAVLGSIVGLRVLTEYLGATEFGILALSLTIFTLFGTIIFAGPGQAVMRFFVASVESGQADTLMRAAWESLHQRTAVAAILTAAGAAGLWLSGKAGWGLLLVAAAVYSIFMAFSTILDGAQNALRQRAVVAWHTGLGQWLRLLFALALFPFFGRTAHTALWGYSLASIVLFSSQFLLFQRCRRRKGPGPIAEGRTLHGEWLQRINTYSWPFASWGIFYWLHSSTERWALVYFSDTVTVGLYAALFQSGFGLMTLGFNVLIQVVVPVIFQRAGGGSDNFQISEAQKLNVKILGVFLVLVFAVFGFTAVFHRPLFSLLVAQKFRAVSVLFPVLVLSGGLYSCGQLAAYHILSGRTSIPLIIPKIGSAIIGTLITILGAKYWGLAGVVAASLVSSIAYLLWVFHTAPGVAAQLFSLLVLRKREFQGNG